MGGVRVCHPLQSAKTVSYPVRPAVFPSLRVSSVALVHPVVVVSPVVDVSAVLRAAAVAPVSAMRWFSFVHEGIRIRYKISVSNISDIGANCIVPFSVERIGMNIDLCDLLF